MAQPQAGLGPGVARDGQRHRPGGVVLDVEAELEVRPARLVERREGGDVVGQRGPRHRRDGPPPHPAAHHAVVVEHGHAIGAEPYVTFQAVGTEGQRQRERLDRVLRRIGPGAAVGEPDRSARQRFHAACIFPDPGPAVAP